MNYLNSLTFLALFQNAICNMMLLQNKMVKFFYVFEGEVRSKNLKTLEELESLIDDYRSEQLSITEREVVLSAKGVSIGDDAALVKHRKILAKYKFLLKNEKRLVQNNGINSSYTEPVQTALPLFD